MAVFIGQGKESTAVRVGLKVNWVAKNIVQPALQRKYAQLTYSIKHVVGIDSSNLYVARAGIRGANDLVWIGRAANYAAKLAAMDDAYPTWITKAVYDALDDKSKYSADKQNMWQTFSWEAMNNMSVYRSTFWWEPK
jgi:class 3 adenylate cyclase